MSIANELIDALAPVVRALRALGVRHFIGGSVASSFHGAARSTMDVDVVCELTEPPIPTFIRLVGPEYYSSEQAIRAAVQNRSCFNLIHLSTSFKVDLFVSRGRAYDLQAMERAEPGRLGLDRTIEVPIASPEDSIISKLEWFRMTDETSDRQWSDVLRLAKLFGIKADWGYMHQAADSIGVADLLARLKIDSDSH